MTIKEDNNYEYFLNEKYKLENTLLLLNAIKREMNIVSPDKVISKYVNRYKKELEDVQSDLDFILESNINNI